jgi:hypothetical protein
VKQIKHLITKTNKVKKKEENKEREIAKEKSDY